MNHYYTPPLLFVTLVLLFLSVVNQVQAHPQAQYTIPNNIEVEMFALRSDGRLIEPCQLGDKIYGCGSDNQPYPYSTAVIDVNLESGYLPFVITQEMGPNNTPLEALKAQAVASRSYALHLYEFSILNNSAAHQVFTPYSVTPGNRHYQAVNETRGIIMICDNESDCEPNRRGYPIFAEFSAGHNGGLGHNKPNPVKLDSRRYRETYFSPCYCYCYPNAHAAFQLAPTIAGDRPIILRRSMD